jgi:TRAP-type C4-dicarboxylate transport system permease small subunit
MNNNITQAVNTALNNNTLSDSQKTVARNQLLAMLLAILFLLLLNFIFGPWLWNNILKRLVPMLGIARWYDTVAVAILFALILPN